jgi:hypothetical protein
MGVSKVVIAAKGGRMDTTNEPGLLEVSWDGRGTFDIEIVVQRGSAKAGGSSSRDIVKMNEEVCSGDILIDEKASVVMHREE